MRNCTGLALLLLLQVVAQPSFAADKTGAHAGSHMNDDPWVWMLLADQFEWQNARSTDPLAWDVVAWAGRDMGRAVLRSEGARASGETADARVELLWSRPVTPWWDVVGGIRQDFGEGPGRSFALLGVEGHAPGMVHVETDLFGGERGQFGARAEAEYDLLITNRLVLVPRVELQAFGDDDPATGVGRGLAKSEFGLRLRYEIRREFAPYAGVEWSRRHGDTADLARATGERVRDASVVAGLRFWF